MRSGDYCRQIRVHERIQTDFNEIPTLMFIVILVPIHRNSTLHSFVILIQVQQAQQLNPNSIQTRNSSLTMKNLFHFVVALGLVCFAYSWGDQQTPVRFAHQSPDAPNVDVYINGHLVWPNIAFRTVTEYMEFSGDTAEVEVKVAGTNTTALSRQIHLDGKPITVAAISKKPVELG